MRPGGRPISETNVARASAPLRIIVIIICEVLVRLIADWLKTKKLIAKQAASLGSSMFQRHHSSFESLSLPGSSFGFGAKVRPTHIKTRHQSR